MVVFQGYSAALFSFDEKMSIPTDSQYVRTGETAVLNRIIE